MLMLLCNPLPCYDYNKRDTSAWIQFWKAILKQAETLVLVAISGFKVVLSLNLIDKLHPPGKLSLFIPFVASHL